MRNIVSLAQKFISIKSTRDNPTELEKILELALNQLRGYSIEKFESKGVKSALVYNTFKRPKKFKVILNGHLDVIPGKEFHYKPLIKKNKLYGVGAIDMKSSVACLIEVFKDVANKVFYPLGLQLVTDEEIGGFNGTKYQIDKGVRGDFIIVGESTNLNIENKTKGILWLKISTKGKTAHGAYPWKGENAVWKMIDFLNKLAKKYPAFKKEKWMTSLNLSNITTNNKTFNKIPDYCEIWLDLRYLPEERKRIISDFKKLLPQGFKIEVVVFEPSLLVNENNYYLQLLKNKIEELIGKKIFFVGANGSSDARHFARVNCPAIEFGPVGGGMGSDKEWVDIVSLEKYYRILKNFLLSLNN